MKVLSLMQSSQKSEKGEVMVKKDSGYLGSKPSDSEENKERTNGGKKRKEVPST